MGAARKTFFERLLSSIKTQLPGEVRESIPLSLWWHRSPCSIRAPDLPRSTFPISSPAKLKLLAGGT